ncbi:MAG: mandelate racemase/muconate lactonizing enzyme family protein [Chloroflexi bacterium]|nr:MAG: mandelate racemase/muconate lactonizing enzyme family protein [Chloroflexota bacterium]
MLITDLDTRHYRIPLRTTMTDSTHGDMTHFEVVMVRLRTRDGVEGLGYTYTIGYGGAAIRSLIEETLKPIVVNHDARRVEHLWEQMWWRLHYVGRGGLASFAISAVDVALWDLIGKHDGVPFWRLLGGYCNTVKVYIGGIDLHLTLEQLLKQTEQNLERGYKAIKIKVGQPRVRHDIQRVKAVRELIGPDIRLMVDANMRWNVETSIRAARQLREYDVYWLEEPTIPDDVPGHARIALEGGVPIATGENLHTIYEFRNMIENGHIAFPEPDVSNIGGITNWMRVAKLAHAHNLSVTTHGVHELHLQLLAAIPNASYLEIHSFGLERFILNAPELKDGHMAAGEAPGHGVLFDWHALEPYLVSPRQEAAIPFVSAN